jgi:hypothetical protein
MAQAEVQRARVEEQRLVGLDRSIRLLRTDVAAVDIRWEQTGAIAPDGSPWGTRKGIMSWVVTSENGAWLVAVWHNLGLPSAGSGVGRR